MVKFAPTLLVAALTFASSSSLAAPTPTTAPESDSSVLTVDSDEAPSKKEQEKLESAMLEKKGKIPTIAARDKEQRSRRSSSDSIRRGIPLLATGTNYYSKREPIGINKRELVERGDLVGALGLTGALAPLGLGGLVDTLEHTIDGLPVVGGPVGGLVHTVDGAVGIGSLLKPVPVVVGGKPAAKQKRQDYASIIAALQAGIPLSQIASALPGPAGAVGGVAGGVAGSALGTAGGLAGGVAGTALGTAGGLAGGVAGGAAGGILGSAGGVLGTAGGLAGTATGVVGGVAGTAGGVAGGAGAPNPLAIIQQIAALESQLQKLAPGGVLPAQLNSHATTNNLDATTAAQAQIAQLEALLAQLQATAVAAPATVAGVPATVASIPSQASTDPLADLSIAQAIAYGLLPSTFLTTLENSLPGGLVPNPNNFLENDSHHPKNSTANQYSMSTGMGGMGVNSTWGGDVPAYTGSQFLATPENEDVDSGSEYSDSEDSEDSEDDTNTNQFAAAPAPWTVTSSSTMAETPSMAGATAEAMELQMSEAGETAVPTSTGAAKRWARNLD
ncbi:hypothetical protein P7C70_g5242, partial [Phenoliferia sp. Uapishka_3]